MEKSLSKKVQNLPTPTGFPIIHFIAATKHICNALCENTPTIKMECGEYYTNYSNRSKPPKSNITKVRNVLTNYSNRSELPKSNITKDEREALCSLKKDRNHMVLTADKGVALVVMDKDTYIEKCMTLLSDHRVYQQCRNLPKTIHAKVIKQLTELKIV